MKKWILIMCAWTFVLTVVFVWAAEQETYTSPQTHTETYNGTPAKLELAPNSNIDIQVDGFTWSFDVRAVDGSGNLVLLTPNSGKPVRYVQIDATLAEIKAGLAAQGVADPTKFLVDLKKALLKVAKSKL